MPTPMPPRDLGPPMAGKPMKVERLRAEQTCFIPGMGDEEPCGAYRENEKLRTAIATLVKTVEAHKKLGTAYRLGDQRLADKALTELESLVTEHRGEE